MVAAGEPLAKVYSRGAAHELDQQILQAFTWSDSRPAIDPLIVEVIDSKSLEVADEN
jgi:hypothetical protein